MGRVSQAQAEENRRRVVDTASRLFREQGTHISVADLMKAAGLTHGGFYKQFASKEALIGEATAHAFEHLTTEHRDSAADGCPAAALAADMAREPEDREARRVYTEGVGDFAEWLATEDEDGLTRLCTMLGALVLARATKGSPLSEQILTAARASLTATS